MTRGTRKLGMALLATLLSISILAFALRLYMGREAEARLRPGEEIAFDALPAIATRNVFVLCPPGSPRCTGNGESPVFDLPWERLREYWKEVIRMQPRIELVASDREQRHFAYLQRSAGFRFPDVVTVEFMALEGGRSSLAIHSRSRYGYTDLGVNRARVTAWIALLERMTREVRRTNARAGLINGATGDGAAAPTFTRATTEDNRMADNKKQSGPATGGGSAKPADKAHSGDKPGAAGKIGETDVAPEHDPKAEKSGRREFGRDG